ncbi:hypothetical protein FKK16_24515 [Klebsiella pneumoniae]|nr:hypothetical protein [Klebsiella pneumoniae]MCQ4067853.1 hypothetical protein [Klebsiella pneumoniae]PLJ67929.1 hypothetical protein B6J69_23300 [Klebsiella pneumoniae]QDX67595.1 hypothetical protein DPF99_21805 [Klebsiella pneumoniae]HBX7915173.1 hypothetical protein [Klebsiella pneumoniae]
MVLHALSRPVTPFAARSRRSLSLPMHLHENRPTKRAGEAGKALRAAFKFADLVHPPMVSIECDIGLEG